MSLLWHVSIRAEHFQSFFFPLFLMIKKQVHFQWVDIHLWLANCCFRNWKVDSPRHLRLNQLFRRLFQCSRKNIKTRTGRKFHILSLISKRASEEEWGNFVHAKTTSCSWHCWDRHALMFGIFLLSLVIIKYSSQKD